MKKKERYMWWFVCIVLLILLLVSIYLGVSGWYFKNNNSYTLDMKLGDNIQLETLKNQSNSTSLNLGGSFLNNDKISQVVSVKNTSKSINYIRCKIYIQSKENQYEVKLPDNSNWTYKEGYYYLKEALLENEKIMLCSEFYIGEDVELLTNKKYIITFLVECLDSEENLLKIWGYNPTKNI